MATFFEKKYFYRVWSNFVAIENYFFAYILVDLSRMITYIHMKIDTVYESPEIYTIEIQGEGLLCSSTEFGNESLDENEGVW